MRHPRNVRTSPKTRGISTAVGATILAVSLGSIGAPMILGVSAEATAKPALTFDEVSVVFVNNRTDHDGQLFWTVTYEKRMADVSILAPDGKLVATARFDQTGQADAHFDSPEPTVGTLKKTYPAGRYLVRGHTTTGQRLASTVKLTYRHVRATPAIVSPTSDQAGVPTTGFVVRWNPIPHAAAIHVQVESDAPARVLEIDLPRTATAFAVPDGFLAPGAEYVVDVAAQHRSGNYTLSDATFTTTP